MSEPQIKPIELISLFCYKTAGCGRQKPAPVLRSVVNLFQFVYIPRPLMLFVTPDGAGQAGNESCCVRKKVRNATITNVHGDLFTITNIQQIILIKTLEHRLCLRSY
jgi:hypothetical protein